MEYKFLKFKEDSLFLVTGGAGFIGSNLCEAILKMGYRVRCLDASRPMLICSRTILTTSSLKGTLKTLILV